MNLIQPLKNHVRMLRRIQLDMILKDWSELEASWTSQVTLVKNLPADVGDEKDTDSIPEPDRSPRGGHSNTLQYSCLENPMDRGAWRLQSIVSHRVRPIEATWHACIPE